jgi:predicted transcriptional regulator
MNQNLQEKQTFSEILETLQKEETDREKLLKIMEAVSKEASLNDVNLFVSKETYKLKPKNQFAILFYDSLDELIESANLSKLDIRIILRLLKRLEAGNLLSYTQLALSKELGTSTASISRSIKRLIKSQILIRTENGEEYVNPQVISKMNLKKMKATKAYAASKQTNIDNF